MKLEAPRLLATFSISGLTALNASSADLIIKGELTKAIAKTIPKRVSIKLMPMLENPAPIIVLGPKSNRSAIPAASCGIRIGMSMVASIMLFPGKSYLARIYAKGTPNTNVKSVARKAA